MRVAIDDRDYIRADRSRCQIDHGLACGGHDRAVAFVGTSRGGVEHNSYFGPNTQPLQPFNPFVCDRNAQPLCAKAEWIGRAHFLTPFTNAPPVCRHMLDTKKKRLRNFAASML